MGLRSTFATDAAMEAMKTAAICLVNQRSVDLSWQLYICMIHRYILYILNRIYTFLFYLGMYWFTQEIMAISVWHRCQYSTLTANSLEYFFLLRDFSFTDYKMDFGYNWFRDIWPQFQEVVWLHFGKELPCERADSLEIKVPGQLEEQMVRFTQIPLVEATFSSLFCKVCTLPCHIWGVILQIIAMLFC